MSRMLIVALVLAIWFTPTLAMNVDVPDDQDTVQDALDYLEEWATHSSPNSVTVTEDIVESGIVVPSVLQILTIKGSVPGEDPVKITGVNDEDERIFTCDGSPDLTFEDIGIYGGSSLSTWAAGMDIQESNVRFFNTHFCENSWEGNSAGDGDNGGAIYAEESWLRFDDCRFEENSADHGGAVFALNTFLTIDLCLFDDNSAVWEQGG